MAKFDERHESYYADRYYGSDDPSLREADPCRDCRCEYSEAHEDGPCSDCDCTEYVPCPRAMRRSDDPGYYED